MSGAFVDKALFERYHAARSKLREGHAANRTLARDVMRMHIALFYEPPPAGVELKEVVHPLYPMTDRGYEQEPGIAASIRRRERNTVAHVERLRVERAKAKAAAA